MTGTLVAAFSIALLVSPSAGAVEISDPRDVRLGPDISRVEAFLLRRPIKALVVTVATYEQPDVPSGSYAAVFDHGPRTERDHVVRVTYEDGRFVGRLFDFADGSVAHVGVSPFERALEASGLKVRFEDRTTFPGTLLGVPAHHLSIDGKQASAFE